MDDKARVIIRLRSDYIGLKVSWSVENNILYNNLENNKIAYSCFERVYDIETNKDIYDLEISNLVISALKGKSCTVFAYGQTGSGKTHTMMGNENEQGLIRFVIEDAFKTAGVKLRIMYLEVYNEKIFDLIAPKNKVALFNAGIKQEIKNAAVFLADSKEKVFELIETCEKRRKIGYTEFNNKSSRSHTLFIMSIENKGVIGTINMIDLAGSEKATGDKERRLEGSFINKSLLALGTVVNSMANKTVVGFRDSKLTRILQSSMNGNLKLVCLCMISPLKKCNEESVSTLNFAARLAKIKLEGKKVKKKQEIICERCTCHDKKQNFIPEMEFAETEIENSDEQFYSKYKKESEMLNSDLKYSDEQFYSKYKKESAMFNSDQFISFGDQFHPRHQKDFVTKNSNFFEDNRSLEIESIILNEESSEVQKSDYVQKLKTMNYSELIRECLANRDYDLKKNKMITDKEFIGLLFENETDFDETLMTLNSETDSIITEIFKTDQQNNMIENNELPDVKQCDTPIDMQRQNNKMIIEQNVYLKYQIELLKEHVDVLEKIMSDGDCSEKNKKTAFMLERRMYILKSKMLEKRLCPKIGINL